MRSRRTSCVPACLTVPKPRCRSSRARATRPNRDSHCSPSTSVRANGRRLPRWRRSSTNPNRPATPRDARTTCASRRPSGRRPAIWLQPPTCCAKPSNWPRRRRRPAIDTANLQLRNGSSAAAGGFETLAALCESAPLALPLFAATLQQAAVAAQRTGEALALLQWRRLYRVAARSTCSKPSSRWALHAACTPLKPWPPTRPTDRPAEPRDGYIAHLAHHPSLVAASRWLSGEHFTHEQFHPQVQRALDQATRPLMRYRCAACGFEAHQYFCALPRFAGPGTAIRRAASKSWARVWPCVNEAGAMA